MIQALVRSSQLDPYGIPVYNGNRPKGKARGIGYSSGSSRLSIPVGVPSWRQWLWPGQSLTQNTRPTGTTFGVRPKRWNPVKRCLILVVALLSLLACGAPPAPTPDAVATQVAQAQAVAGTLTAAAPTHTSTATATWTPTATHTSTPTPTPTKTSSPVPTKAPTNTPTSTPIPVGKSGETAKCGDFYEIVVLEDLDWSIHSSSDLPKGKYVAVRYEVTNLQSQTDSFNMFYPVFVLGGWIDDDWCYRPH